MSGKIKWFKTGSKETGFLYYKKHPTRKHGIKFDRYHRAEYQFKGKRIAINFGWASDGWTELKCLEKLNFYKNNAKNGLKPISLKEEREIEQQLQKAKQEKLEQEKRDNKTFGEFFENIYLPMTSKHKKEYTVKNEFGLFNNWIKPEIGHLPFNKIKPFNLEKIKENILDAGRTPRTLQYCFAVFRQAWNQARIDDLVNKDCPTRKVKRPKVENKRNRFLTHEEADLLLKTLKKKSQQTHDMALLSLHTGVRAGEIYSLTWAVVNLKNSSALIRDAKGNPRHIYLTEEVQKMLERLYHGQVNKEFVFKDRNGQQVKCISKTFERVVSQLGFNVGVDDDRDKVLFHTCRHTFASWHAQNGTDLYIIKELLGHSTITLTERYSHLQPKGLKETTKLFNKKDDVDLKKLIEKLKGLDIEGLKKIMELLENNTVKSDSDKKSKQFK